VKKALILILAGVLLLAILKVALTGLLVALGLALLVCLVTRLPQTIAALGVAAVFGAASLWPTAFFVTLGVVGIVVLLAGAWLRSRRRPLLIGTWGKRRSQLYLTDGGGDR
jgi:hypothetical protein